MNFANWNIRGLNKKYKQEEIRSLIHQHRLSLIGINETRVSIEKSRQIGQTLLRGWHCVTNYDHHLNGRIWVLWDPNVLNIQLLLSTSQVVHMEVEVIQKQIRFHASFLYGLNTSGERRALWESISQISSLTDGSP